MKKIWLISILALILSGCAVMPDGLFGNRNAPTVDAQVASEDPEAEEGSEIPENARTVEEFDTTTADDRAAALNAANPSGGETDLGLTIASLGTVTEPGIWLKTPLVSEPGKGRVVFPEQGTAVAVDLIPLDGDPGAGSRISLAAMRLLEVDLASLPELRVYRIN